VEYAVGIDYVTNMEIAMGVNSINQKGGGGGGGGTNRPGPVNWAATLGSLDYGIKLVDLADGAATIADMGVHHEATPVTKIIDNLSGRTLFKYDPIGSGRRVVPENVAFIMNEITSNDSNRLREFGSHGPLTFCDTSIGDAPAECARRVSAKTGTADYFLDNLTVGWTPDLLTAVWVGNSTRNCLQSKDYATVNHAVARGNVVEPEQRTVVPPSSYPSSPHDVAHYGLKPVASDHGCGHLDGIVSGYSGAAPIWHQFMYNALKGTPKAWYTRPADIVASGPGDDADFFIPSSTTSVPNGCFYWGTAPDPNNPCTYTGTEPPAGYVPPTPGPAEPAPTTAPAPRLCKHPPCRPAP